MDTTSGTDAERTMATDEQARKDAEWTARMAEADRQWQAHHDREAAVLPLNKAALFEALAAGGIASVVVTFDGSGDAGQIEDVTATTSDGQQAELPAGAVAYREVGFDAAESTLAMVPVEDLLEKLAYALLEQTHDGWEINDGAYGEFTFDVAAQTITLDYNERYTASEYHCYEF